MIDRPSASLLAMASLLGLLMAGPAHAEPDDPYLWLEEVSSARSMAWVEAHNAASTKVLEADPRYATAYHEQMVIASAKDRIATPRFMRGAIYNFWTDADHLRGYWRKTTLGDYRTASPHWTTVLDIDALGKAEGRSWVYTGVACLMPERRRCMVSLSDGGEDAAEFREFDLDAMAFVEGGFRLPRGKQTVSWLDADHLLVSREWQKGDLTVSGYPFVIRRLARGQPLDQASEVFRGDKGDMRAEATVFHDGHGSRLAVVARRYEYFRYEHHVLTPQGLRRLAMPPKSNVVEFVDRRVIVELHEPWTVGAETFAAGALVDFDLAGVLSDPEHPRPRLIWSPGPRDALEKVGSTRDKLLLKTLDNVRGRAAVYTPTPDGGWSHITLDLPDNLSVSYGSTDEESNLAFVNTSGFLTPNSLSLVDTETGRIDLLKTLPPRFDTAHQVVEQFEATSSDGTKVPYFVVHRDDIKYDGSTPTLLYAYGGFEINMLPVYLDGFGKAWLERGGAYAMANIRGGGEFGPAWHEASLGAGRQLGYDDFAAVGRDLIARRITSPRRLGIEGVSNGGLLVGVEFVQHPELWNAVVIRVPLLDMIRMPKIAAGASWKGEYGDMDKDPAALAFWQKTSPYQNLRKGTAYPEPFIFTTTKDDRVGPQHARKFAARLEELGLPFLYYENTEGGHGSGADLKQTVHTIALATTYLYRRLMD
jgi:prolyl oligopeptidase